MKEIIFIKIYQSSDFAFTNISHYPRRLSIVVEIFCPELKMLACSQYTRTCIWGDFITCLMPALCAPAVLGWLDYSESPW